MNWNKIGQNYDLEHPVSLARSVIWIANQMIHSFTFMPCFDPDGRFESILFNSDRTGHQYLYAMDVDEIISLFEEVGANNPISMQCRFNPATGDYDVSIGPTMEPDTSRV